MPGKYMTLSEAIRQYGPDIRLEKVQDLVIGTGVMVLPPSVKQGDGVYRIIFGDIPSPAVRVARPALGNLSSALAAFTRVLLYTVPSGSRAIIKEIAIANNNRALGRWQIIINGTILPQFDGVLTANYAMPLEDLELAEGGTIEILGGSDGATTVIFDAAITLLEES